MLHELGETRLANASKDALVTRARDGSLVVATWYIVDPAHDGQPSTTAGKPKREVTLKFKDVVADARVTIERVDDEHGNVLPIYKAMGSPQYPTEAQVAQMNAKTALPPAEVSALRGGELTLELEPDALVLVRVGK